MFWHKKLKQNWTLLFFSLIALGIILSVAIILLVLVQKINNPSLRTGGQMGGKNQAIGSAEVSKNYLAAWDNWQKEWSNSTDKQNYLAAFGNTLETMRVPVEKLDLHLKIFLDWNKQKAALAVGDLGIAKTQINSWINQLTAVK